MRTHAARRLPHTALLSLLAAASASCALPLPLGPRDAGGVYMILAVRAKPDALAQSVHQAAQVIETRCGYLGVQCRFEPQGGAGSGRMKLSVSGSRDTQRLKAVLLAEGRLELRPVVSPPSPSPLQTYPTREAAAQAAGPNKDVVPYEEEGAAPVFVVVERPVVAGPDLRDASAVPGTDPAGDYKVLFSLRPEGAYRFGEWTGVNINRHLAVVLNGRVLSVANITSRITDSGQITGRFTKERAEDLALTLRSGSLPAPVEVLEEGAYGP